LCLLQKTSGEPLGTNRKVQRREYFLPLTVFILKAVSPAESIGGIKDEF